MQPQINYKELELLEKEFQQILVELAGDQSLMRFKHEYDKLYRALKRSHDNQRILFNKMSEQSRDLANQTAKLRLAMKLSQEDSQTIAFLKTELDKSFKMLEISKEREEINKQKIETMNSKIKVLQSNLDQFQVHSAGQSSTINDLKRKKEELHHEKEQYNDELIKIKTDLSEHFEKLRIAETDKNASQQAYKSLEKDINEIDEKLKKDEGRKAKIQEQLDNLLKQKDSAVSEISKFRTEQDKLTEAIQEKKIEIEHAKEHETKEHAESNKKNETIRALKAQYMHQMSMKTAFQKQNSSLESHIEELKKELNNSTTKTSQMEKEIDKLRTERVHAQQSLAATKRQNEILMNRIPLMQRQIMDRKKLNSQEEKEIEELESERMILQKELLRLQSQFKTFTDRMSRWDSEIGGNQLKIKEGNQKVQELKVLMTQIEKQKEAYAKKAAAAVGKYQQSEEEIKLKNNLISEYQKKTLETASKLKEQQELYESVRSDRNTYSKALSETEDEIAETKRRYKIVNHQIKQLKDEIEAKQVALAKQHFEHKKKDQTLNEKSRELEKRKKDIKEKEEIVKNLHNQISKLHHMISYQDRKRLSKKDEYDLIVAERDILGTQLIRRNDEAALLYEKIKIQQATLAKGQAAFRERLSDLNLLEYKKSDLRRELRILMRQSTRIPKYKEEILKLQSDLIEKKLQVNALSEELENPLNVHRCRNLKPNEVDPNSYEMKEKIKTLQKRLIFKTEQVVEKEVMIHQKEKQTEELKQIMKRQPGIEVAEKLSNLQRLLNIKVRKMKELAAQINMYQARTSEFKYDIERIQKEINEIRRKYNEHKKREQVSEENEKMLKQQGI